MKKILVLALLSLLVLSFLGSVLVSAADTPAKTADKSSGFCKFLGISKLDTTGEERNWFCKRLAMWEPGITKTKDMGMVALFFKYIMLFLLIVLIYSALDYAQFPESGALKITIAVLLGFLTTFLISTEEMIAAMTAYSALGITIIIFFPILVLGFFTILVASKANPAGIFIQRIMWIIYATFLFLKAGTLALGKWWVSTNQITNGQIMPDTNLSFAQLVRFIIGQDVNQYQNISSTVLLVLIVVSISVFYLMVWKDHTIVAWLAKEKREAEIEGERGTIERAKAYDKLRAEQMEKQK